MASLALAFDVLARDKGATKTLRKIGDESEHAGKRVKGAFSGVGAIFGGLAGAIAGAGIVNGLKGAVSAALESQKISALTEQVIKSTGGAAKLSAKQVGDLATAISNKTGVDDEAIQSGANMLLTFTNVRNEVGKGNDIFSQATGIITDMSVALGSDTKGAAIQLGKALNDPIKGVSALSKVGVSFTAQQKKQIKTLVDSGKTMDAQKIILAELGREFGGAAKAAATPLDRLKVAAGNLQEQLGFVLLPVVTKFSEYLSNHVVPAVSRLIEQFQDRTGAGGKFRDVLERIGTFLREVAVPAIQGFVQGIRDGEGPGGAFRDIVEKLAAASESLAGFLLPVVQFLSAHPKVFESVAVGAALLGAALKVQAVWGAIVARFMPGLAVSTAAEGVAATGAAVGVGTLGAALRSAAGSAALLLPLLVNVNLEAGRFKELLKDPKIRGYFDLDEQPAIDKRNKAQETGPAVQVPGTHGGRVPGGGRIGESDLRASTGGLNIHGDVVIQTRESTAPDAFVRRMQNLAFAAGF